MNIFNIFANNKENIYDSFPDAIIVLDFMRHITKCNKKAEVLFGYTKRELKNKNITMLFNEDIDKFNKIIGLNHGSIIRATTKSGENIFVDVTAYDSYNASKTVVAIRALSNKFLELQSLLDDYQATKALISDRDSFLSNLKLDLLNPVNAALGFAQSLSDETLGQLNEQQKKYINIINSNNKKLKELLEKVFEIIALDANKKEFNFKNFEYNKLIDFVVNNQKQSAIDKGMDIITNIQTDKKNIYSDEYAFARVLEILVENAIKFSSAGTIQINAYHPTAETLEFHEMKSPTGYNEQSYLQIEVVDNGIGVSQDRYSEIFDEYCAKNFDYAQKFGGLALSLPIARKIIRKLGGDIWQIPNGDNGSIFTFVIPIEKMIFE